MKICYSVAGEGRGHASRALVIADELGQRGHEIVFFTFGEAYDFLCRESQHIHGWPEVVKIKGIQFSKSNKIDIISTTFKALKFLSTFTIMRRGRAESPVYLMGDIKNRLQKENPDIIITDFEPSVPYLGRRMDIPIISFDHQHFLDEFDFSEFGLKTRIWARLAGLAVRFYCGSHDLRIVTSFFDPGSRNIKSKTIVSGPIIRQSIKETERAKAIEPFVLAYLNRLVPDSIIDIFKKSHRKFKIYGLGERPADGQISFHDINETSFTEDLINCTYVVATAGNQLTGEAMYCGKPMLALPLDNQPEQYINAEFLATSGGGDYCSISKFSLQKLYDFEQESRETFKPILDEVYKDQHEGNDLVVDVIENFMNKLEDVSVYG